MELWPGSEFCDFDPDWKSSADFYLKSTLKCQNCSLDPKDTQYYCESCTTIKFFCMDCKDLHDKCVIFRFHHIIPIEYQREEVKQEIFCHNCQIPVPATKKCVSCADVYNLFCNNCATCHLSYKPFEQHTILEINQSFDYPLGDPHEALKRSAEIIANSTKKGYLPFDHLDSVTACGTVQASNPVKFVVTKNQLSTAITSINSNMIGSGFKEIVEKEYESVKGQVIENNSEIKRDHGLSRYFKKEIGKENNLEAAKEYQSFFHHVLQARFGGNKSHQNLQEFNRLNQFFDENKNDRGGLEEFVEKCLEEMMKRKIIYLNTIIGNSIHLQCFFSYTRLLNEGRVQRQTVNVCGVLCPFENFQSYYHFINPKTLESIEQDADRLSSATDHLNIRRYEKSSFPFSEDTNMKMDLLYFINYPRAMGDQEAEGPRVFVVQRIPDISDEAFEFRYVWYIDDTTMKYKIFKSSSNVILSNTPIYGREGVLRTCSTEGSYQGIVGGADLHSL